MHPLGILFLLVLQLTSLLGDIFLLFPAWVLINPFSWTLYRKYCDFLAGSWFRQANAFFESVCGVKIVIHGDQYKSMEKDSAVLISNHRTRLDWMFLWSLLDRSNSLHREKIVLKDGLKKAPGFGWAMQKFCFLFLKRKWEQDEHNITKVLNHYASHQYPVQLLIFPEGTNMSPNNKILSDQFAEKNKVEKFNYVLHPRVRGFIHTVECLRDHVDAVYDITMGFLPSTSIPENESAIVKLQLPKEIHFFVERIDMKEIPKGEQDLTAWVNQRWKLKEKLLTEFYTPKYEKGIEEFSLKGVSKQVYNGASPKAIVGSALWIFAVFVWLYGLYSSSVLRYYALIVCIIETIVTFKFHGSDHLEVAYHSVPNTVQKKQT